MRKATPRNVEPGDGRDPPYPIAHDPAEVRGWNWRGGLLRSLLVAFLALGLVGMVLLGIEREAAEIDFQLLVTSLRATPAASLAAALAATALSYLALIGSRQPRGAGATALRAFLRRRQRRSKR
jgi:hypothetical protein